MPTPLPALLEMNATPPIGLNPGDAKSMKEFIMPDVDALKYLDYFDEYVSKNAKTGSCDSLGEAPIPLLSLATYVQTEEEMFFDVADVYDNALTVLYLTMRGSSKMASQFLSTLMVNMCMEGYNPSSNDASVRLEHYVGLRPRYSQTTGTRTIGNYPFYPFSRDNFYDTGNNMFVGIALCRYILRFTLSAETRQKLVHAAYDTWCFASTVGWCDTSPYKAFMGRPLAPDGQGRYISIEHNIDAFSFLTLLGTVLQNTTEAQLGVVVTNTRFSLHDIVPVSTAQTTTTSVLALIASKLQYQRDNIRTTVASLFMQDAGNRTNSYATGTGFCGADNKVNVALPSPTDAVTWNYLSGVDPNPQRKTLSLQWSVNALATETPWNHLMYAGLLFSSDGTGIQWENTGAGLLAYVKYMALAAKVEGGVVAGVKPEMVPMLSLTTRIGRSLTNLINIQRAGGIPASFEGQGTIDTANTGFNWSYFAFPHTASTMWSAMGMRFLESGFNEAYNPYSLVSGTVVTGAQDTDTSFLWMKQIQYPVTCQLDTIPDIANYPAGCEKEAKDCGTPPRPNCQDVYNLGLFCGYLNDKTNPGYKGPGNALHTSLTRGGSRYCANPNFTICNDVSKMARGAAHLYKDIKRTCSVNPSCLWDVPDLDSWQNSLCKATSCILSFAFSGPLAFVNPACYGK